jgi:hypothetical protein
MKGSPFCGFHHERALEVFCVQMAASERDLLHRNLERIRSDGLEQRETLFRSIGIETALLWDAASAAARLAERVYFFAADYAVKIGRSVDPAKRVKTLRGTKAPDDIDLRAGHLVGTIPGGCRVESELHGRFYAHRLVGEWFTYAPIADDIASLIAEHQERAA